MFVCYQEVIPVTWNDCSELYVFVKAFCKCSAVCFCCIVCSWAIYCGMAILWLGIVVCNVQVVSSAQQHSSNCLVCMYILLLQITDNGLVQHYRQAGFFVLALRVVTARVLVLSDYFTSQLRRDWHFNDPQCTGAVSFWLELGSFWLANLIIIYRGNYFLSALDAWLPG